jgi:hypothetical protein
MSEKELLAVLEKCKREQKLLLVFARSLTDKANATIVYLQQIENEITKKNQDQEWKKLTQDN